MKKKQEEQDAWLQERLRTIDDKNKQLGSFLDTLEKVEKNNLFVQAWSINKNLSKAQQAALIHFRGVLLSQPEKATEGDRYAESIDLITDLTVTPDEGNKGWWLHLGNLREFVPETSMLLPDISTMSFDTIEQLKAYLESEMEGLRVQRLNYVSLQNGKMPEGLSEYDFDIDLSDTTKVNNHQLAAQLCAVVGYKLVDLEREQEVERAALEAAKQQYGITLKGVDYAQLLQKIERICEDAQSNYERINELHNERKLQITSIDSALPSLQENKQRVAREQEECQKVFDATQSDYQSKYLDLPLVDIESRSLSQQEIFQLENQYISAAASYVSNYNQIVGKYTETKDQRDIRINEQIHKQNFNFEILEQALLGGKIRTLDEVTDHLENLNTQLLSITDELLASLIRVFGRTEAYFDRYKELVNSLNDFFRGKLISNRFYFRIDFEPAPKLNIQWIEHLRKSASSIADAKVSQELSPEQFIEDFYMKYSGNKSKVDIEDLLNPKRYFVLKGRLTDQNDKDIPGSTGESYTAVALLGIARLSVVQDGNRAGLRFIILEESATLDNVNFSLFPMIAKEYGYQIITMTPKPYAIGDDDGWFIHQLIPGKENLDINYPRTMSYFRTNKSQIELGEYLKARNN
jgi:exonuclease SbcC